jgi:hypothetical protein
MKNCAKKKITIKLVETVRNAIFLYIGHYSLENTGYHFFLFLDKT